MAKDTGKPEANDSLNEDIPSAKFIEVCEHIFRFCIDRGLYIVFYLFGQKYFTCPTLS